MSPPVNQPPPSAAKDAGSASDEPKTPHVFAEHGRNSPAFLARIRRAQRHRRYWCAAFGLSLLTVVLAHFAVAANGDVLEFPSSALVLVVIASSLLVLVASPLAIIWTTLRIAWQRQSDERSQGRHRAERHSTSSGGERGSAPQLPVGDGVRHLDSWHVAVSWAITMPID